MELALRDLFQARWSRSIHDEWMRSVLKDRPDIALSRLERTRNLMDEHARDALVTDYEHLIPCLTLPDPDDRHVLAAAIRGRADVIVTSNLKDFPVETAEKFAIEIQHPDDFLTQLMNWSPGTAVSAVREVRVRLKNPPKTVDEYLECLEGVSLIQFVTSLREYKGVL